MLSWKTQQAKTQTNVAIFLADRIQAAILFAVFCKVQYFLIHFLLNPAYIWSNLQKGIIVSIKNWWNDQILKKIFDISEQYRFKSIITGYNTKVTGSYNI